MGIVRVPDSSTEILLSNHRPLNITMDDEDAYGIPSDYYHSEAILQGYPDNAAISPFDDILDEIPGADDLFEDFAECMRVAGINSISCGADFHANDSAIEFLCGTTRSRPV
jgi:hypothetical protein